MLRFSNEISVQILQELCSVYILFIEKEGVASKIVKQSVNTTWKFYIIMVYFYSFNLESLEH